MNFEGSVHFGLGILCRLPYLVKVRYVRERLELIAPTWLPVVTLDVPHAREMA